MMLELVVCRITGSNLMDLGLSRTAVVGIAEYIVAGDLDREQVTEWVGDNSELLDNLPTLVRKEIARVFER